MAKPSSLSRLIVCVVMAVSVCAVTAFVPKPTVTIPAVGKVQGHRPTEDPSIVAFLGIRYAEAPVGDLRWASPKPTSWDNFQANQRVICVQPESFLTAPNATMTEDCLRLNIWVRDDVLEATRSGTAAKVPVLVYIHGGSFVIGSGIDSLIDPHSYVGEHDIILVTMNYRLGAFGFLAHPHLTQINPAAPTNFGLLDQRAALQWIHKNIKFFGGDATQITISGDSAGAVSALAHLKNAEPERQLFKRAIVLSPVPVLNTLSLSDSELGGRQRAARVGCGAEGNSASALEAEVACLRLVAAESLIDKSARIVFFHAVTEIPTAPVSDGVNFDVTLHSLIEGTGTFANVDIIMGTVLDEGSLFTYGSFPVRPISEQFYPKVIENAFASIGRPGLVEGILRLYSLERYQSHPHNYTAATMHALSDVLGDSAFTCPTTHLMSILSRSEQRRVFGFAWAVAEYSNAWLRALGTGHSSETEFFFGKAPSNPPGVFFKSFSEEELELGRVWRESIAQFIQSGNPTTPAMKWVSFEEQTRKVLIIESASSQRHEAFKTEVCEFWEAKFPEGGIPTIMVANPLAGEEFLSSFMNEDIAKISLWLYQHKSEAWIGLGGILVGIFAYTLRFFFTKMYAIAQKNQQSQQKQQKKDRILAGQKTDANKKKRE